MPSHRLALSVALLTLLAAATANTPAAAVTTQRIEVLQAGIFLGVIEPYAGSLTAVANYNYLQPSGMPIHGPAPAAFEGRLFFYLGADGLYFNVIFNSEGIGNGTVDWSIRANGSTVDPVVKFSDDPVVPDLAETSDNVFAGGWGYEARVDGGVIGPLDGSAWTITIDQVGYTSRNDRGIDQLRAFDVSGAFAELIAEADRTQQIVLRAIPVPEPSTVATLTFLAMIGHRNRRFWISPGSLAARD